MLLSQAAGIHLSKASRKITKKLSEVTTSFDKDKRVFTSVIKEENDSSESDNEDGKQPSIDLTQYLEEVDFGNRPAQLNFERKISDFSKSIKHDYDIIGEENPKKKRDFREGEVEVLDRIEFIHDYLNADANEGDSCSKWHSIITPKSEVSSSIVQDHVTIPKLKFGLVVKSVEVRIYEGLDFCFQTSQGLEKQVKESIVMGFDHGNAMSSYRRSRALDNLEDPDDKRFLEFDEIQNFFEEERDQPHYSIKEAIIDENQGRVRTKKRGTKRYFQFLLSQIEFSYLDLTDSFEGIDSQLGFTIEKVNLNEIHSREEVFQIFRYDNDLDSHKNLGLKIIFLQNKTPLNEKCMEFYFMSETIKITMSHLSTTFAYLLVQPITLFIKNEMRKDEQLIEEVKSKSSKFDPYKSLSVKKINEADDDDDSAVWDVTDSRISKKTQVFIKYMHIKPFRIKLNYTSDNLNIVNLCKGDLLNYITNMVDIAELRIKIREFKLEGKIPLERGVSKTIEFYLKDLIYNQKLNLLASVYPIRVTLNILKAFVTLIVSPVSSYMNEKHLLIGIYQGFSTFLTQITHEFSDVGGKLLAYISSWKNFIN